MRIALYHNLLSGGAKRALFESVKRLAQRHTVDVYTLSCAEHTFADIRPYVGAHTIVEFQPLPLLTSPFGRLNQLLRCADLVRLSRIAAGIARTIDEGRYDVAFIHPCQFEASSDVLARLRRTHSVYYCQEPLRVMREAMPPRPYDDNAIDRRRLLNLFDPLPGLYRRVVRHVERRNARSAGAILVNSRFMADVVARTYGVTPEVSYLAVDLDAFRPLLSEKRHFVLSVGSLTPLKGFDFLLRSLALYPASSRPSLVIASNFANPEERAYLDELALRSNVDLVVRGNVADPELARLYNEARVVAYTPHREPFGLVPLEAMACGTPVVAVREGGVSETVIDRHTGLLTERDPKQFADALHALIDNPDLARQYGENGRRHVEKHWNWNQSVEQLEMHLRHRAPAQAARHGFSTVLRRS